MATEAEVRAGAEAAPESVVDPSVAASAADRLVVVSVEASGFAETSASGDSATGSTTAATVIMGALASDTVTRIPTIRIRTVRILTARRIMTTATMTTGITTAMQDTWHNRLHHLPRPR